MLGLKQKRGQCHNLSHRNKGRILPGYRDGHGPEAARGQHLHANSAIVRYYEEQKGQEAAMTVEAIQRLKELSSA